MWEIYFTDEIWIKINCFNIKDMYYVSTYGNIKNESGKILSRASLRNGYPSVCLVLNSGKTKTFNIHKIMETMFNLNDDPNNKTHVDHIDVCPTNNFITNLQSVTPLENIRRRDKNRGVSMFNEENVNLICEYVKKGCTYAETLEKVGIDNTVDTRRNVSKIICGETWKNVSKVYGFPRKKAIEFL